MPAYCKARILRVCFHFEVKTLIEWNQVRRHVGRLSHLTTVGLMLIQTQTWWEEDYCRLLEYLLRKLFKDGIIQNIQQYLSALCKSLTSALLFVALCVSPLSLSACSLGKLWTRIREGHLLISIPKHKSKAEVRKPKSSCETGAERCGGAPARPYHCRRCVCLLHGCVVNDEWFPLCLNACCHIPVNEAASYSLVGVMGLAWLQPNGKWLRAAE